MIAIVVGTVLPWLLVAFGAWLGYQLVRQNGRMLLRLEAIDEKLHPPAAAQKQEPSGLAIGTVAPDFELPDLSGKLRRLSEFRDKNVLLIFFNPQCGFCARMSAELAALSATGGRERAMPLIVSTGDADENRRFFAEQGIRCAVLLQEQMKVAAQFGVHGTPMGYWIDGAGRIASEMAVGAEPLLQLAVLDGSHDEHDATSNGSAHKAKHDDPSLARSRLNRNGLKAGTPAPEFRLPLLKGGELSLADLKGRRVLLVFSDPDCGPCDQLAPRLQQLHLERTDLQVLVVSRRDAEANRVKAAKLGLSFPVVLQKQWEISLKYAMFATPIGYLIDERGILAGDVAVGVEPILALAEQSVHDSYDESVLTEKEQAWAI